MKIGVISDIHNNLAALQAVLTQLECCDAIVCCGDIIGIGPHPEETVRCMMALPNLIAVQGNHDRYFTEVMPSAVPNSEDMGAGEMAMHRWEHARLSPASAEFLRSLPLRAAWEADGLRIAVQHYAMDAGNRYTGFTPSPAANALDDMFSGVQADIVLYGHDHAPWVQRSQRALYIDPGALGCPGHARSIARAGMLCIADGRADYRPLEIRYDAAQVIAAIDRAAYPESESVKKYFFGIE